MKGVTLILLLVTVFLSGCVSNDVDAEIKELVKDIPIPTRYSSHSGELIEPEKIIVSPASPKTDKQYDPKTGIANTGYRVTLLYDIGFGGYEYKADLTLYRNPIYPHMDSSNNLSH